MKLLLSLLAAEALRKVSKNLYWLSWRVRCRLETSIFWLWPWKKPFKSDDGTAISQNNVLFTGQAVATEWQLDVDIKLTGTSSDYTNLLEVSQVGVVSLHIFLIALWLAGVFFRAQIMGHVTQQFLFQPMLNIFTFAVPSVTPGTPVTILIRSPWMNGIHFVFFKADFQIGPSESEALIGRDSRAFTLIGQFLGNIWDRGTGNFIQSSIGEFWGVTQAVLLENSSRPNVTYHIWFQSKNSNGWVFQ